MRTLPFILGLFVFSSFAMAEVTQDCPLFFKKSKLCGKLNWTVPPKNVELPTEKDTAEFTFELFQKTPSVKLSKVQSKYEIQVQPFMPSMGHGSIPTRVIRDTKSPVETERMRFTVKNVLFSMPGDWEIRIHLKDGDRKIDQVVVPYTL